LEKMKKCPNDFGAGGVHGPEILKKEEITLKD
jgi:hypothetical protein